MRTLILSVCLFSLTACSGADFSVADPGSNDTGTVMPETGSETSDTNPVDTGGPSEAGSDTGTSPDTGTVTSDTGTTPDTSPTSDSGTVTPDSSDAAPPECTGDILGCFTGNQPRVCIDSKWQNSGGTCTWNCNSGKCDCKAPGGRFVSSKAIPDGNVMDSKLGKTWNLMPASETLTQAKIQCAAIASRLPTTAEVLDLIAQQAPAILCATNQNLDYEVYRNLRTYTSSDAPFSVPVWTSDVSGPLAVTVQVNSGTVGTRDPAVAGTGGFRLCISK